MSGSAGGGSDAEILKLGIDSTGVQKGADAAEAALDALVNAADKTEQALDEVSATAKQTGAALSGAGKAVEVFNKEVQEAGAAAQTAGGSLQSVTGSAQRAEAAMAALAAENAELNAKLEAMRKEALATGASMDALTKEVAGLQAAFAGLEQNVGGVGAGMGRSKRPTDEAADAFRRHAAGAKLSAKELQMLAPQLNDIFTQLSMGQGVMMTLMAQGPQIVQGFGGVAATFRRIVEVIGPFRLGMAAAAAAGLTLIAMAEKQEKAILNLGTRLMDVRKDYEEFARSAEAVARRTAASSPATLSEARDASRILGAVKGVEATDESLGRLIVMAKDLAAVMGKEVPDAAEKLAAALKKPDEAAREMAEKGSKSMNTQMARSIELLVLQGKTAEAQTRVLKAIQSDSAGAAERSTSLGRAWEKLSQSAQGLGNALMPLVEVIGSGLAEALAWVIDRVTQFTNFVTGAAKAVGDWYEKAALAAGLKSPQNASTFVGPTMPPGVQELLQNELRLKVLQDRLAGVRAGLDSLGPSSTGGLSLSGTGQALDEMATALSKQIEDLEKIVVLSRERLGLENSTLVTVSRTAEITGGQGAGGASQPLPVLTVQTPSQAVQDAVKLAEKIGGTTMQMQTLQAQAQQLKDALGVALGQGNTDAVRTLRSALQSLGQQMEGLTPAMARYARDMADQITVTRAGEGAARALAEAEVAINNAIRAESGGQASAAQIAEARRLAQEKLNAELDVYIQQQQRRIAGLDQETAALKLGLEAGEQARISVQAQAEALKYGAKGSEEYEQALKRLLVVLPEVARAEKANRDAAATADMRLSAEVTRQEADTLGMGARDRARRLAEIQEEAKIRREKGDVSSAGAQERIRAAASLADAQLDTEQMTAAFREIENTGTRAFERIGEAITQAFATGELRAISLGNISKAVMSEIAQTALKLAIVNPLKNWVFGSNEGTLWSASGAISRMLMGGGSSGGGGSGGGGVMDLLGLSSLIPKDGLLSAIGLTGPGGLMSSVNASLFGTAGTTTMVPGLVEPSIASGFGGMTTPGTAGLLGSGGTASIGGLLGGAGLGFGAGSFVGSLIAGNSQARQTNSMIGAGLGSLAGVGAGLALNLAFPGLGTLLALGGGLLGGGAGGLIGPRESVRGYGFRLQSAGWGPDATPTNEMASSLLPISRQFYNDSGAQAFQAADELVAATNAYLSARGLTVGGVSVVGGNKDGPDYSWADAGTLGEAFTRLRFGATDDERLGRALSGQSFEGLTKLQEFVEGFTQTAESLDALIRTPTEALAKQLEAVGKQFDALSEQAKKYALSETGLLEAREKALTAVYQASADSRRQMGLGLGNDAVQASGLYGALQASRNLDPAAARDAFLAQLKATTAYDVDPIAQIYRVGLGRAPDASGIAYYQRRQAEGMSQVDIANSLLASPEAQARYAGMDNAGIIGSFYRSAFNREADASGLAYWTGQAAQRDMGSVLRDILANAQGDDAWNAYINTESGRATYQFDAVSRLTQSSTDLALARERRTGGAALFSDFMGGAADAATEWAAVQTRIVEPLKALGLAGDELAAAIKTTTDAFNKAAGQAQQATEVSITAEWLRATGNDVAAQQMEFDFQRSSGREALVGTLEKLAQPMGEAGADWISGLLAKYDETTVLNRARIGAGTTGTPTDYAERIAAIRGESRLRAGIATTTDQQAVALMQFDAKARDEVKALTAELGTMGQTAETVATIIAEREAALAAERLRIIDDFAQQAAERQRSIAEVGLNLDTRRMALTGGDTAATRMALFDIEAARETEALTRTLADLGASADETAALVAKLAEVRGLERDALVEQIAAEEARRAQALADLTGDLQARSLAASGDTVGADALRQSMANAAEVAAVTEQLKALGASADVTAATLGKLSEVQAAEAAAREAAVAEARQRTIGNLQSDLTRRSMALNGGGSLDNMLAVFDFEAAIGTRQIAAALADVGASAEQTAAIMAQAEALTASERLKVMADFATAAAKVERDRADAVQAADDRIAQRREALGQGTLDGQLASFDASAAREVRDLRASLEGLGVSAAEVERLITDTMAVAADERLAVIEQFSQRALEAEQRRVDGLQGIRDGLVQRRDALAGGTLDGSLAAFDAATARELRDLAKTLTDLGVTAAESASLIADTEAVRAAERLKVVEDFASAAIAAEQRRINALATFDANLTLRAARAAGDTSLAGQLAVFDVQARQEVDAASKEFTDLGVAAEDSAQRIARLEAVLGQERLAIVEDYNRQMQAEADRAAAEAQAEAARAAAEAEAAAREAAQRALQIAEATANAQVRIMRAMGNPGGAALLEFDQRASAERRGLSEIGGDTALLGQAQGMERAALVFDLARSDYVEAIDRQIAAITEQTDGSNSLAAALGNMADSLNRFIADVLTDASVSTLTPEQRLAEITGRFGQALTTASDTTASAEDRAQAVADAQRLAQDRLQAAQEVYGRATGGYSAEFEAVRASLSSLSAAIGGEASGLGVGLDEMQKTAQAQLEALRQAREDALALGERQLGSLDALKASMDGAFAALQAVLQGGVGLAMAAYSGGLSLGSLGIGAPANDAVAATVGGVSVTADGYAIVTELQAVRAELQALKAVTAQGALEVKRAVEDATAELREQTAAEKLAVAV